MFVDREQKKITYNEALEEHILRLVRDAVDYRLLESELFECLGSHKQIVDKIGEMEYKNQLRRVVVRIGDVEVEVLQLPPQGLSVWTTMKAMPCFTCEDIEICKMGNSSNSVDCTLFNNWILDKHED